LWSEHEGKKERMGVLFKMAEARKNPDMERVVRRRGWKSLQLLFSRPTITLASAVVTIGYGKCCQLEPQVLPAFPTGLP
jgi:hypothetical protein